MFATRGAETSPPIARNTQPPAISWFVKFRFDKSLLLQLMNAASGSEQALKQSGPTFGMNFGCRSKPISFSSGMVVKY